MKKFNLKFAFQVMAFTAFIAGCNILDLDENPKNVVAPANFYQNVDQVEAVFSGVMRRAYANWGGYGYPHSLWHTDYYQAGNLNIVKDHGRSFYALHFANIKDLNFAIDGITKNLSQRNPASVTDPLIGQAKFLRAWNYFMLVRMWGPVPLVTEADVPNYFTMAPPNSTIADIYALIVSDFTEAIQKLPDSWPASKIGRPNKSAAKGLLAKTYITMATAPLNDVSKYASAAALAKEMIDEKKYTLVEDIDDMFLFNTMNGPEIIWSYNANDRARSLDPRAFSSIYGWWDFNTDRFFVDSIYPEQPRKHIYLETRDREGRDAYSIGRGVGVGKLLREVTPAQMNAGTGLIQIPIIRMSEIYLIYAEAANMVDNGPTQAAVDAANAVIDRANGGVINPDYPRLTTSMTKQQFDDAIIWERCFELIFEYDRWFDLIRKRIIPQVCRPFKVDNFKEHMYLFPIPESEFRVNPNIQQNPGY